MTQAPVIVAALSSLAMVVATAAEADPRVAARGSTAHTNPAFTAVPDQGANDRGPTAGAPYYIHFGPSGLCVEQTDWRNIGNGEIVADADRRLISIKGGSGSDDEETYVHIFADNLGTTTAFDDELVIAITVYKNGPDFYDEVHLPLYDPGSGGLGGYTTQNTPKHVFYKKIEYRGASDARSAILNEVPIPMFAVGWFGALQSGESDFRGGPAPDCIRGSNNDDVIRGGGGSDYIRGLFGNDFLSGGDGNDTLVGGADNDLLFGNGGVDRLIGEDDDDCLSGGQDGLRDVLEDDSNVGELNFYVAEPGVIDGVAVPSIEYMTEPVPQLVDTCL